jgi:hypothetical protein
MHVSKRALKYLTEGLDLLRSGRTGQARFFLEIAVEIIERSANREAKREEQQADERAA